MSPTNGIEELALQTHPAWHCDNSRAGLMFLRIHDTLLTPQCHVMAQARIVGNEPHSVLSYQQTS